MSVEKRKWIGRYPLCLKRARQIYIYLLKPNEMDRIIQKVISIDLIQRARVLLD